MLHVCATCKWRSDDFTSVCVNGDSERRADFVCKNDSCEKWERKDNGKAYDDKGGEVGMTYGEMYKKSLETIHQEMVSDYRPANYSSGFKLMCSDYCNSILIWLKNGDEIIYTVKGQQKQEG